MSSKQSLGRAIHIVAALVGVAASWYLLGVHADVAGGAEAGGLCNLGEGLNCTGAATSVFATFLGVPIAALGFGFYVGALVLSFVGKSEDPEATSAADVLVPFYLFSVAYSLFLLGVSVGVVGSICPACAVLYGVNGLGLAGVVLWSGRGVGGAIKQVSGSVSGWLPTYGVPLAFAFVGATAAGALLNAPAEAERAPGPALDAAQMALLRASHAPAKGPEDAAVVIVEFSDFECPFCARLANHLDEALEGYEDRVRLEFRQFPLDFHMHAADAAKASHCAGLQGQFWPYHDALFAQQDQLGPEAWVRIARETGVDADALQACLDAGDAEGVLEADRAAGLALGVAGTPAFFVNGTPYVGALPVSDLREIIAEALGEGDADEE